MHKNSGDLGLFKIGLRMAIELSWWNTSDSTPMMNTSK